MRTLIVSEFVTLDGVMQAPGGKDEDRDGGFEHGGWTWPYWHDDIGETFGQLMQNVDAFLLGRRTYQIDAEAFEPMAPGDPFGEHHHRWQQPAGARVTGPRSDRGASSAGVSSRAGQRQAAAAAGGQANFRLKSARPYPSGVVGLHYERAG
jgi:hypothetical protein